MKNIIYLIFRKNINSLLTNYYFESEESAEKWATFNWHNVKIKIVAVESFNILKQSTQ